MKKLQNLNGYELFSAFGIFVLGWDFLAIVLAMLRIFYWPILLAYLLAGASFLFWLMVKNYRRIISRRSIPSLIALIIITLSIVTLTFFTTPSVFSGRDQGSFSEAAIRLAQNHQLEFDSTASQEFFKIYGPGTALNFPGFNYTPGGKLVTHFSLGYIAWLAGFYAIFGLSGFSVANGVLFFLFLLSFFLLLKLQANTRSAWIGLLIALSTFIFSWLFKFTLSENLALGFIWFGVLELSLFLKFRNQLYFLSALGAFLLLAFTRIEAWALLLMLGGIIFIFQKNEKKLFSKHDQKNIFWLLGIFVLTFTSNLIVNSQFYRSSLKGLLHSFSPAESGLGTLSVLTYLFKIFYYYNLLIFLLIAALAVIYFLAKKNYLILMPFFLLLPLLIYLVHPGISLDHPWMLRRFAFAIIPLSIYYTVLIINRLFTKKNYLFFLMAAFLLLANLAFSAPLFTFSENETLLMQTKTLSENFSATDLVLVDRLASGDGWSIPSGPLSFLGGLQAVYFFNPDDLVKIDTKKFTNVYLIIPNASLSLYDKSGLLEKLIPQKPYSLSRNHLIVPDFTKTGGLSEERPIDYSSTINGEIYLLKQ
ncbi:MAG: hypothetical protein WC848_03880 [Parcubacteria group bacterium]|jgi:hypothetical protein